MDQVTQVEPKDGEEVVVIPQAFAYLMSPHRPELNLIGHPRREAEKWVHPAYGQPKWDHFRSNTDMPWFGTGLLVVRDGILWYGPTHWDTSG